MSVDPNEFFRLIDLSTVPAPDFVEVLDYETMLADNLALYRSLDPDYTALVESDPVYKLIEAFTFRELNLRQRMNDIARANTITESVNNDLTVIGALFSTSKMEGEAEEAYRRRIQLSPYTASVGGPRQAYEFHALSSHPDIVDVSVYSPAAGDISVTVLAFEEVATDTVSADDLAIGRALFAQPRTSTGAFTDRSRIIAGSASAPIRAARDRLSGEAVRPMTDAVTVQPPTVVPYTISARLVVYPGPDSSTVKTSAIASLSAYLQSVRKISYDATTAGIIAALKVGGVQNVIINSPMADVVASYYDLPVCLTADIQVDPIRAV